MSFVDWLLVRNGYGWTDEMGGGHLMSTNWPDDARPGVRDWLRKEDREMVEDTNAQVTRWAQRHMRDSLSGVIVDPAPPIDATPSRSGLSSIPSRLDHSHGLKVPACRVSLSLDQSLANDTTVDITWDTEDYDTDAIHSTASNTSRLTVPSGMAGIWSVTGVVYIEANASGRRQGALRKNGADGQVLFTLAAPPSSEFAVAFQVDLNLAAADYLELRLLQNSGGPLNLLSGAIASYFGMRFIRRSP